MTGLTLNDTHMWGSATVYAGLVIATIGMGLIVKPVRRLRITTRTRALLVGAAGALTTASGLRLPVTESRVTSVDGRFDEMMPAWQFRERHTIRIDAAPERVFEAIRNLRADEILLFRTLTWIRRGGRQAPESILNPGTRDPLLDVATRSGFLWLADDPPREIVIGTAVIAPPGWRERLTPQMFREPLPSGVALAAMNFLVTKTGRDTSFVSTETRVFANSPVVGRRFARYWRVIYPGSALIRRMWLRAIQRRATRGLQPAGRRLQHDEPGNTLPETRQRSGAARPLQS